MAESYLPQQRDGRTFGVQVARLLDDLGRPDLSNVAIDYLQDAMRYFQRVAFFFSETDNRATPEWQPNTMYPLGSTIRVRHPLYDEFNQTWYDQSDAFVAVSTGIKQSGEQPPVWPEEIYTPWPGTSEFYEPPPVDEWGVVQDNEVIWANTGAYVHRYHTQLSSVPNVNQYIPPLDWTLPYLVQMTTANLRLELIQVPFLELQRYDVIQPAPIAAYPRWWSWWQKQIYVWVYPAGFYPITLHYQAGPNIVVNATDSNYWTTEAERLVRKAAQAAISREVLYDTDAAQLAASAATEELARLKSQAVAQLGYRIPGWDW